ncbi:flagellin N-terminal helical domain-containing protein [Clostridium sp. C105KSO13]|uniref:flagellin N-terminal helical domain-containing protein n=1 Tax=Clostridium sp. C105KSO13 TaxID=1776045 RepID=UPI0007407988|nr:flagellin [Clostridium sp. C105KSO13]CUX47510.1 Flagellin [Clostridium sp. C105KSO13]
MRIQHNIAALNSYRNLTNNNNSVSKNLEKLSSGYKINRAGDDAAGLAISEKMRAQITGLETAQKNANDGISLVQTAEGALTEVHSMLNRMVELAGQSANGTYDNDTDRANIQKEVKSLTDEIDRISEGTNFNGINLLDGSLTGEARTEASIGGFTITGMKSDIKGIKIVAGASGSTNTATLDSSGIMTVTVNSGTDLKAADLTTAIKAKTGYDVTVSGTDIASASITNLDEVANKAKGSLSLQIGDTAQPFNQLKITVQSMSVKSLGLSNVDLSTQKGAKDAVDAIKTAINTVSSTRGELGANQNRLEHTINNLSVTSENMTAAESRIRDVDMAKEMMSYTKNNILVQASQAMLAQANQIPQGVLQLLQ